MATEVVDSEDLEEQDDRAEGEGRPTPTPEEEIEEPPTDDQQTDDGTAVEVEVGEDPSPSPNPSTRSTQPPVDEATEQLIEIMDSYEAGSIAETAVRRHYQFSGRPPTPQELKEILEDADLEKGRRRLILREWSRIVGQHQQDALANNGRSAAGLGVGAAGIAAGGGGFGTGTGTPVAPIGGGATPDQDSSDSDDASDDLDRLEKLVGVIDKIEDRSIDREELVEELEERISSNDSEDRASEIIRALRESDMLAERGGGEFDLPRDPDRAEAWARLREADLEYDFKREKLEREQEKELRKNETIWNAIQQTTDKVLNHEIAEEVVDQIFTGGNGGGASAPEPSTENPGPTPEEVVALPKQEQVDLLDDLFPLMLKCDRDRCDHVLKISKNKYLEEDLFWCKHCGLYYEGEISTTDDGHLRLRPLPNYDPEENDQ